MGKLYGMKQRRAAEYWDTLCNGTGPMNIAVNTVMFQARNMGQKHLSNLDAAGQFPSDNTFVTLAMSCTFVFYTLRNATSATGVQRGVGVSQTPGDLQFTTEIAQLVRKQLVLIYRVGEKMSYEGFADAYPAAQGLAGAVAVAASGASEDQDVAQGVINNGTTDYGSLLRLGKPEVVAARQHFEVEARFATLASQNPAATNAPPDVTQYLNAWSSGNAAAGVDTGLANRDYKHISVRILGVHTRDVQ